MNQVYLVDHSVKSEHHPSLEIVSKGQTLARVEFNVTAVLTLRGLELLIQDAKIKTIRTGSFEGEGTITIGQTKEIELAKKSFEPIQLPGAIDLGEGISLGPTPGRARRAAV